MKTNATIIALFLSISTWAQQKQLKDFFLPMQPQAPLVSQGIWGAPKVLPRDTANGLEDATLKNWCYWDGRIIQDDQGLFHIYASRWNQKFSHAQGWKENSKATHAISHNIMGPYKDLGMMWPHWNNGLGHNVVALRMTDGRYAAIASGRTPGDVFVSDKPCGPFSHLGEIQVDSNGYSMSLARMHGGKGNMSNVQIIIRPDGKYMLIGRSTAILISDNGILGPYKIKTDRMYRKYPNLPQSKNEDPTLWYSGGLYHVVYNHWPSKTSYHFTSKDGVNDWTYRGIAYKKGVDHIFRYPDGTINDWTFAERPTAYVNKKTGHVTHFIFSVIDLSKGQDQGNDENASKIVVVPFDGKAFDEYMETKKNE